MRSDGMDAKLLRRRQTQNLIVARCIPVVVTGIVVYVSWAFVGPLCVDYLINTPSDARVPRRVAVGIALPIVYFALLLPMAVAYFRLLYIVLCDPGYLPQRPPHRDVSDMDKEPAQEHTKVTRSCAATTVLDEQEPDTLDYEGILKQQVAPPAGIEQYWTKDVFVCDGNGLPLWCPTCCNWKPDRSHHSSDVGRCVTKMDHFCPWVGGMVGENGYKFFFQFVFYATIFATYVLVVMAYFVGESEHKRGTKGDVHWVVTLGLGGFFTIFTFGLVLTSTMQAIRNLTTVENIDHTKRAMFLAVILPPELQTPELPTPPSAFTRNATPPSRSADSERPLTSEIDDPSHLSYFNNGRPSQSRTRSRKRSRDDSIWQGTITYPLSLQQDRPPIPAPEPRTFAILRTPPGMNPWNLGPMQNLKSVLGYSFTDWALPVRRSPCIDHSTTISQYALGFEFERLLNDAKLMQTPEFLKEARRSTVSSHKKRKRRLEPGWANGERPDGWVPQKEARRMRRERRHSARDS